MKVRELIAQLELENKNFDVMVQVKNTFIPMDVIKAESFDGLVIIEADLDDEGSP